jgi:Fe-S-cluster-containing dehydrogenase component
MELNVDVEKCCGCRVCEVVCTFHHYNIFGRKASSIEVKRIEREGKFKIMIHKYKENSHLACDFCEVEKIPLCAKFCPTNAIIYKEE